MAAAAALTGIYITIYFKIKKNVWARCDDEANKTFFFLDLDPMLH